jgi:hypothetical protein
VELVHFVQFLCVAAVLFCALGAGQDVRMVCLQLREGLLQQRPGLDVLIALSCFHSWL